MIKSLQGPAGTGKTEQIYDRYYGLSGVMILAPTNKAAHVLRTRGITTAQTIHSALYDIKPTGVVFKIEVPVIDPVTHLPVKDSKGRIITETISGSMPIIRRKGFARLLDKMEKKLDKGKK